MDAVEFLTSGSQRSHQAIRGVFNLSLPSQPSYHEGEVVTLVMVQVVTSASSANSTYFLGWKHSNLTCGDSSNTCYEN